MTRQKLSLSFAKTQPVEVERICQNCRFWEFMGSDEGECRRKPPYGRGDEQTALWPVSAVHDWCGEFKRRPIEPQQ